MRQAHHRHPAGRVRPVPDGCSAGRVRAHRYEYLGEFGIPGRRYLRKGGDERTHQIHIFAQSDRRNIERHLAVRDYLRTHPEAIRQYGALKTALAARFPYDIEGYCDGKATFMQQLERDALIWRQRGQAAIYK